MYATGRKFSFAQKKINLTGYVIQRGVYTVNGGKLRVISEFPVPRNIIDLRSINGLVEQLVGFSREPRTYGLNNLRS